ncbi:hypothetical protein [uncultured Methanolobus sp.]|uniref:hypothetical protein n=1 Tax=uncultured Methanolobus sp. TaxID=218300 RepID=UPI002AAB2A19|nr:hypothetical protein [uncultured Methanolobus sp.]
MNQKYGAIFLAAIMVMSIFSYFVASFMGDSNDGEDLSTDLEDAPGFEVISGTHFGAELDSISDGLTITPEGATNIAYVDYARVYNTPLQILAPNITDLYSVYNTMIVRRYSASNNDDFAFEAHVLNPEVVNFGYMAADTYNGYQLLSRNGEFYSVIGTPTLLGSESSLEKVIDVSSGTASVSTGYSEILSYVEPGAEYQMLSSEDMIADQHYLEFRNMGDGNYSKTEIFLNPLNTTLETISSLEDNSTERNLMYDVDIEDDGRIAKVVVTANASNFFNLAMEQFY